MSTFTSNLSSKGFSKLGYNSWDTSAASQGRYGSQPLRVGVLKFNTLLNVDWADQVISEIRLSIVYASAGRNASKTLGLWCGTRDSISGSASGMIGSSIGDVPTNGSAYNTTRTITFSASSNASAFANFVDYLQTTANHTIVVYRNEAVDGEYSYNYLKITGASIAIDYEPAGSKGTLNKTSLNAGESIGLTITPLETTGTLTHTVQWSLGSAASDIVSLASGVTTTSYTVPMDWCIQLPSAVSGDAKCTLKTYLDGTFKATREITFTVNVPSSVVPTFTASIAQRLTSGGYYQFLGGATISVANPVSYYGATIASTLISGSEGASSTSAPYSVPAFQSSGAHSYTVTLTDTRGKTASQTLSITVTALANPSITTFSVSRYSVNVGDDAQPVYTASSDGANVWFNISASIDTAGGNNTPTAYIKYRVFGTETWTQVNLTWSGSTYTATNNRTILTSTIQTADAYEFELHVEDKHTSKSAYSRIEKATCVFHASRRGVGVGMYATGTSTSPKFESAYPAYFYADINPDWVNVTPANGTTPSTYGGILRYKKIGRHVFVDGSVNLSYSGSQITIFTLPEGYRPGANRYRIAPCAGSNAARLAVLSDGQYLLEWIKKLSDGTNAALTNAWVDCAFDFWMD